MKGRLIVIDGTDGSGKATQTQLLVDRFKAENLPVETISFPQYGTKSAGSVEEYLSGKYGSAYEVTGYQASVLFAVDRFDASFQIRKWLEDGINVITDRYVGANMGHQGSKITDPDKRKDFFAWEMEFEHELMGIPKPDINLILHVPSETAQTLMEGRELKSNLDKDIHEENAQHLKDAEQAYLDMTKQFDSFQLIDCVENGELLDRENIHKKIWGAIKNYI
ncbi:thymidylate kinase [Candidatus Uhrbacteria bacterium]|jgi:dTMP kinase|nr:thymidylate kinase [Candidatus Uhrbacteria bacterium]